MDTSTWVPSESVTVRVSPIDLDSEASEVDEVLAFTSGSRVEEQPATSSALEATTAASFIN